MSNDQEQRRYSTSLRRRLDATGSRPSAMENMASDAPPYQKRMAQAVKGNVVYTTGEELKRPPLFPRKYVPFMFFFVMAAVVISGYLFSVYYGNLVHSSEQAEAKMNEYIARGADKNIPMLTDFLGWTGADVVQYFVNTGENVVDLGAESGNLNMLRVSSELDASEASTLYSKGIASLSAVEGAKLLGDFWHLDGGGDYLTNLRVRYVDFTSGEVSKAVAACLTAQGIDASSATDEGVDSSGNTYKEGSVDVNGTACTWRASAIAFSKVYDIDLPDTAVFVGFRLTQN